MRNALYFIVGIAFFCGLQSCTQRMICPAYQSAFIHDKDALERHFSYFAEDSTPKLASADKDRFLIVEPVSYRKKVQSLQTVAMVDVYPVEEDSLAFDDEFYLAERDIGYDSTAVIREDTIASADSVYVISIKKEKFNIDEELYLWYLKDHLVYPDVRLQMEGEAATMAAANKQKKEKKGFFGFFKNLFKKKDKSDSTATNFDQETSATELEDQPKEKKGLFNFLKKKNKKDKTPQEETDPENNQEASPPANEDDGEDDF